MSISGPIRRFCKDIKASSSAALFTAASAGLFTVISLLSATGVLGACSDLSAVIFWMRVSGIDAVFLLWFLPITISSVFGIPTVFSSTIFSIFIDFSSGDVSEDLLVFSAVFLASGCGVDKRLNNADMASSSAFSSLGGATFSSLFFGFCFGISPGFLELSLDTRCDFSFLRCAFFSVFSTFFLSFDSEVSPGFSVSLSSTKTLNIPPSKSCVSACCLAISLEICCFCNVSL